MSKHPVQALALAFIAMATLVDSRPVLAGSSTCSCTDMNAESVAEGTCSKGEDSSSLCRMEWNGGSSSATQTAHGADVVGAGSAGQSASVRANRERFLRLSQDGGERLSQALIANGGRFFSEMQQNARNLAGNVQRPVPARVAARTINKLVTMNPNLRMEVRNEISWSVVYLGAYTFFPFADEAAAVSFGRALRRSADDWIGTFVQGGNVQSMPFRDPDGPISGQLRVSQHCLMAIVGTVKVMIKGPLSQFSATCG